MSKIFCKNCGMTGDSKCPHCRTIFVDKEYREIFVLSTHISLETKNYSDNPIKKKFLINFNLHADMLEIALMDLEVLLSLMREQNPQMLQCALENKHSWVFSKGESSEIECGH